MAEKANQINFTSARFHEFCDRNPGQFHSSISHEDLTRLDPRTDDNHIPAAASSNGNAETPMQSMKCCCGRSDCAFLVHNDTALGGLEKDLETAARLGQVRVAVCW